MTYLDEAADCISTAVQKVVQQVSDKLAGKTKCPYCTNGKTNYFGEERFEDFILDVNILKTNGKYFLEVPNRHAQHIVACPMCGRQFENCDQE